MNLRYSRWVRWPRLAVKYFLSSIYPLVIKLYPLPRVKTIEQTLDELIEHKYSISRYGDSEFLYVIDKLNLPYQKFNPELRRRMIEILVSDLPGHCVGLPIGYQSMDNLIRRSRITWRSQIAWVYPRLRKYLDLNKTYYNASMTRVYVTFENKSVSALYFRKLMLLWEGKHVLLIEGDKSRLGVGNDLFANCTSVERILAPAHNAFEKYDELLFEAKKHDTSKLVLIALGPTATVLAYDLAKAGYQALDIGNVDIEYEWYRMGATSKVRIPGKYTSEAVGGRIVDDVIDESYHRQIVARFL